MSPVDTPAPSALPEPAHRGYAWATIAKSDGRVIRRLEPECPLLRYSDPTLSPADRAALEDAYRRRLVRVDRDRKIQLAELDRWFARQSEGAKAAMSYRSTLVLEELAMGALIPVDIPEGYDP